VRRGGEIALKKSVNPARYQGVLPERPESRKSVLPALKTSNHNTERSQRLQTELSRTVTKKIFTEGNEGNEENHPRRSAKALSVRPSLSSLTSVKKICLRVPCDLSVLCESSVFGAN
jgi:hypothetical protein